MSKKQVLLLTVFLAIPAAALLTLLVLQGLENGANMFSGVMTVLVILVGVLCIALVFVPIATWRLYPEEGFASLAPPPPPVGTPSTSNDEEEGDFADDEFEDEEDFGSGGYDGDEELYDDEYDDEYDDDDEW